MEVIKSKRDCFNDWLKKYSFDTQKVYTTVDYFANIDQFKNAANGDQIITAILQQLEYFYEIMHDYIVHRTWHKHMIRACLPSIYGYEQFIIHEKRLTKEWNLNNSYGLFIKTSRRMGKTISNAQFVATLLIHCPNQVIAVFAPVLLQAIQFLQHVVDLIYKLPDAHKLIHDRISKETLYVKCQFPGGGINRLKAYCSNARVGSSLKSIMCDDGISMPFKTICCSTFCITRNFKPLSYIKWP